MLGTTLSMAGFWIAVDGSDRHRRLAGGAFFAGVAVGLLAKGPIAAVLVLVPIGAFALWSGSLRNAWRRLRRAFAADPWRVYFALWAITPLVFFTPAGNILITYVLPGLPAFALLVGESWRLDRGASGQPPEPTALRSPVIQTVAAGAALPLIFVAGIALLHRNLEAERSQKALVRGYESLRPGIDSRLVYFLERPDSAQFYTQGRALKVLDWTALRARLVEAPRDTFAIRQREMASMPPDDRTRLERIATYGDYLLLRSPAS